MHGQRSGWHRNWGRPLDRVDRPRDRPQRLHGRLLGHQARPDLDARAEARRPRRHRPRASSRPWSRSACRSAQMAEQLGVSYTTVRHWLKRYELETPRARRIAATAEARANGADTTGAPVLRTGASHSCAAAATAFAVSAAEWMPSIGAGVRSSASSSPKPAAPACSAATRDHSPRCTSTTSTRPRSRSLWAWRDSRDRWPRSRAEAAKCVLLCARCHAEVEAGVKRLTFPPMTRGDAAA